MHEPLVRPLDEETRLGLEALALRMDRLDASEQPGVQVDGVVVRGQLGREALLDRLQRVAGVRLGHREEDARGPREHLPAALHGGEGVVERGRVGQARDRLDLRELLPHALLDGGLVVGVGDPVERGGLVGKGARAGEGTHGRAGSG